MKSKLISRDEAAGILDGFALLCKQYSNMGILLVSSMEETTTEARQKAGIAFLQQYNQFGEQLKNLGESLDVVFHKGPDIKAVNSD